MIDCVDAAYYLFYDEIPHTTQYESLLALVARLDHSDTIKTFMERSSDNASYSSHNTAVEFLDAVPEWLRSSIVNALCASSYISLLADEATDLRTRTELTVCFRYVKDGEALERYFCLQQLMLIQLH